MRGYVARAAPYGPVSVGNGFAYRRLFDKSFWYMAWAFVTIGDDEASEKVEAR